MKIGYYPGCSLTGTGKEYDLSLRQVLNALDVELDELIDWSCCGATSAHATNHLLSLALPARNLSIASKQRLNEVMAPCAACYNRLIVSQHEIETNPLIAKQVEDVLGEPVSGKVSILNIIELFEKSAKKKLLRKSSTI